MSEDPKRRRDRRYDLSWSVEISTDQWEEVLPLTTDNVSRGGLFVVSEHFLEPNSTITVSLHLPDGGALEMEGNVMHSVRVEDAKRLKVAPGFGVRFAEKHAMDLSLLEAMAASHGAGQNASRENVIFAARVQGEGVVVETSAYQLLSRSKINLSSSYPVVSSPESSAPGESSTDGHDSLFEITVELESEPSEVTEQASSHAPSVEAATPQLLGRGERFDADHAIFGIDFGTSYTSIALVDAERLRVLADEEGQTLLPSAVSYPPEGRPLVGWLAREKQLKYPSTTFVSPKRLLGRSFDDPHVDSLIQGSPLRFQAGPQQKIIAELYGEPVSMPQVCAQVIGRAMEIGERASGIPVRRAVLSAPIGFGRERDDLRRAAEIAGLEVVSLLNEPSAAAVAYGLGRSEELIAVYDFGGGTFDFTLVKMGNDRFESKGRAGDAWLGGDDFDIALASYAASRFEEQRNIDLRKREVEWQRLLFLAERAKRQLSVSEVTDLHAKGMLLSVHGPVDLKLPIDRPLLEELCGDLVERSIEIMSESLEGLGLAPAEVDRVVMVGGVARMPLVRRRVEAFFGRTIPLAVDPEQAVVAGNAIFGRILALNEARSSRR
ncbi:MAG: Hsp70 family protein [Deltaproteobacteria bacterium]|nr:Hsp70 family protein [Deltaproteobacteria bacterium]